MPQTTSSLDLLNRLLASGGRKASAVPGDTVTTYLVLEAALACAAILERAGLLEVSVPETKAVWIELDELAADCGNRHYALAMRRASTALRAFEEERRRNKVSLSVISDELAAQHQRYDRIRAAYFEAEAFAKEQGGSDMQQLLRIIYDAMKGPA